MPEACTSPDVYARILRGAARPVDGQPVPAPHPPGPRARLRHRRRLPRRPRRTTRTARTSWPSPTAPSICTTRTSRPRGSRTTTSAADDDGVVRCVVLGATVGLMSGWEWARNRTAARVRAGGAQLVLGGMCWPSMLLNWPGCCAGGPSASTRAGAARRASSPVRSRASRACPSRTPRTSGPVAGETPLGPGIPWRTVMVGESQVCDRNGPHPRSPVAGGRRGARGRGRRARTRPAAGPRRRALLDPGHVAVDARRVARA